MELNEAQDAYPERCEHPNLDRGAELSGNEKKSYEHVEVHETGVEDDARIDSGYENHVATTPGQSHGVVADGTHPNQPQTIQESMKAGKISVQRA
ncbi:hypothetical protein GE061_013347 [Apolygus lucorum]|uniref:Uncharacterized protein n=1 Tax=Apolygus lucorum TaxID=248454 RepID=A0A8S9XMR7_APOLU|nr:hypothetical protein GE061_013347 [Apolygus lucorum]